MDRRELPLNTRPLLLALLLALMVPLPAQAGIYSWRDADGHMHFGEQPPANARSSQEYAFQARATPDALQLSIQSHGQPLPPDVQKRAEAGMTLTLQAWQKIFRVSQNRQLTVDAHVFDSQNALRLWIHEHTGIMPGNIIGIFIGDQRLVGAVNFLDNPDETLRTLLHESNHVVLAQLSPNAPPWLHEGLAQYFEGIDSVDGHIVVRPHETNDAIIRQMIEKDKLISLRAYLSISPNRWFQLVHGEGNPIPYVVAWSLTSFMMAQSTRRQMLVGILQDLEKAKLPPDLSTFAKRYPGGLDVLEYDWYRWAMQPAVTQQLD